MTAAPTAETRTILVIEDDRIVLRLLDHMFTRRGYRVSVAADGREACSLIEEGEPPSLVLLDVMLPYLDGFEVIRRIRERPDWKDVPIIMLTAKAQERNVVRALDAGASDYVVKPFKPEELIARVRRFVG
ncbi:MAG: response regulator [Gemmatimonadetes bacterium]|nr:response regulator [Gemmatimonadota bacterium]